MKKAGLILIIIGLIIVMIPVVGGWYNRYQQNKLLEEFRAQIDQIQQNNSTDENTRQRYDNLDEIFREGDDEPDQTQQTQTQTQYTQTQDTQLTEQTQSTSAPQESTEQTQSTSALKESTDQTQPQQTQDNHPQVIGTLQIKRLNIDVIVVEGVKDEDLKVGVGHFPGTAAIGDYGNSAIAGHRSYTFGRFFNRLNEVKIGDKIHVSNGIETFEYTVYKTHIVEPKDTYVLNQVEGYRILTLVTCEPIYIATHRLIVHARILD